MIFFSNTSCDPKLISIVVDFGSRSFKKNSTNYIRFHNNRTLFSLEYILLKGKVCI